MSKANIFSLFWPNMTTKWWTCKVPTIKSLDVLLLVILNWLKWLHFAIFNVSKLLLATKEGFWRITKQMHVSSSTTKCDTLHTQITQLSFIKELFVPIFFFHYHLEIQFLYCCNCLELNTFLIKFCANIIYNFNDQSYIHFDQIHKYEYLQKIFIDFLLIVLSYLFFTKNCSSFVLHFVNKKYYKF
ncbi:hypothetical protein RFI_40148 [Reticulomyxa filosa]|uniref:Uncharacterized protein n=1 Tax=Reticulomyxa filosa TaxID=46433 RepID=X6L8L9_RETFI|nr:hypothetical protein RFI_40148 [Reticulomyxa filosa]|eukprot:ETN97381.1 hypothetical protein RFI_40148 [Reticulomyxa filosa]